MRSVALCLLALACSPPASTKDTGSPGEDTAPPEDTADTADTADTGEAVINYITYEGTLAYLYGDAQTAPREYACQLYWDIDPAIPPAVIDDCPDCAFAFAISWTLDNVLSRGSGGACDGDRNGDFAMDIGFRAVEDLPGTYAGYMLERIDSSWTDQTMASFNAENGSFVFAIGELDDARDDGGTTVFDSDQWYGSAIVWDGSPRPEDEEEEEER